MQHRARAVTSVVGTIRRRTWSLAGGLVLAAMMLPGAQVARANVPAGSFVFNSPVTALAHAGDGSTFVGGGFTQEVPPTGGAPLASIVGVAKLTADGSLDTSWNANGTGACVDENGQMLAAFVRSLALEGSTIYVAGCFASVGGQPRSQLAALDTATAAATPWNPAPNGVVNALAADGSTVYAGGNFTTIGGQNRTRLAALDAGSGNATVWAPNPDGVPDAFAVSGSTVYVGGYFTTIAGQARNGLAAFNAGNLMAWNPNGFGVDALALSGSTLYAAGVFGSVGGQSRRTGSRRSTPPPALPPPGARLRISLPSLPWQCPGPPFMSRATSRRSAARPASISRRSTRPPAPPRGGTRSPDGLVYALATSGSTVYVGGGFNVICGQTTGPYAQLQSTCATVDTTTPPPAITSNTTSTLTTTGGPGAANHGTVAVTRLPAALAVTAAGQLTVTLKCTGTASCMGSVTLTTVKVKARARGAVSKTVTRLAAAHYTVNAGKSARVQIKLTAAARKLLRRVHKLKATLNVSPSGAAKPTVRRWVTLRLAKHHG